MKIESYLNDFMNYLRIEKNSSHNTINSYKKDVLQYVEESGVSSLEDMSRASVRQYMSAVQHLAPSTRGRKLSAIRSFMQFLVREGLLEKNYGLEIDKPKIDKRLPHIKSAEDTAKYIDEVDNPQDRAILETLYGVGCRIQELVSLKKSDINLEKQTVRLFGKGSKERNVPINGSALKAIAKHLETRGFDSDYIFGSKVNPETHMTTRNANKRVKKHTKGEMHPHMFRHSYATHLHENGVDIRVIQGLLGHADINTTTIYTSLADEHVSNAYRHAHPRG